MTEMTDKQYDGILQMVGMILEGCRDIDEARRKIDELRACAKKEDNDEKADHDRTKRSGG